MKLRTRTFAYGVVGLMAATAVISTGSALGLIAVSTSGVLSVMLTDPPSVPTGVSAIYLTYTSLGVHPKGLSNTTWIPVSGEGTLDTMKLVNFSQTISTATVPSLTYDRVKLNISRVEVEYYGRNYSTAVGGSGMLTAPIMGGLVVNASSMAATLVDLQPTVLNLGNQAKPEFTMATGVKALQVPSGQLNESAKEVGHTASLEGNSWFQSFETTHSGKLAISALSMTPTSFTFTLTNHGSDPADVRLVVVTEGAQGGEGDPLGALVNAALFAVHSNGTLQLAGGLPGQAAALLAVQGCSVGPGSTQVFSFSGSITTLLGGNGAVAGATYYVTVIGPGSLAIQSVPSS